MIVLLFYINKWDYGFFCGLEREIFNFPFQSMEEVIVGGEFFKKNSPPTIAPIVPNK